MDRVTIERLGGLAGFGLPGARVRSAGELDLAALSAADRASVEALFARPPNAMPGAPDGFRYKITRGPRTIDVPESDVPAVLRACVKDQLL